MVEQSLQVAGVAIVQLLYPITVTGLDRGLDHQFHVSMADDIHSLVEGDLVAVTIEMAMDVLDDGRGLLHIGEQLGVDVLIEISIDEVIAVERRNDEEIINVHRQVTVAVNAVDLRKEVGKHHRDLESTLLIVG